jgi:serine/threonine protein kinase
MHVISSPMAAVFINRKKTMKYFSLQSDKMDGGVDKVTWKLKSRREFVVSLSKEELERLGGKTKLEQPPTNRYFKFKNLRDIVLHHGNRSNVEERESLVLFVHLLKGLLHPDPCERLTAYQALSHPFFSGKKAQLRRKKSDGALKSENDFNWSQPWDPSICRRKLSLKQGAINRPHQRRTSLNETIVEAQERHPQILASPKYVVLHSCIINESSREYSNIYSVFFFQYTSNDEYDRSNVIVYFGNS